MNSKIQKIDQKLKFTNNTSLHTGVDHSCRVIIFQIVNWIKSYCTKSVKYINTKVQIQLVLVQNLASSVPLCSSNTDQNDFPEIKVQIIGK